MTPVPPRRARRAAGMLLVVMALATLLAAATRESVDAQELQCGAAIDGVNVTAYADHRDALSLDADEAVSVSFAARSPDGSAPPRELAGSVRAEVGPFARDVISFRTAGGVWRDQEGVSAGDHLRAVGLYRVVVEAEGCDPITGWVRLTGPHPLTTPIGAAAAAVGVAGALAALGAAVRGWRASRGLVVALLGGVLVGLAGCVLDQQFGNQPFGWNSWVRWTIPPTALAGLVNAGTSIVGRRRRTASREALWQPEPASGGAPTPLSPSPSPPEATESAPPPSPASATSTGAPPAPMPWGGVGEGAPEAEISPAAGIETYMAHGLLDCPPVVVAGREFDLRLGLAPETVTGVSGGPFELPVPDGVTYELAVELDIDGFTLRPGQSPRQTLLISDSDRFPVVTVPLTALPAGNGPEIRSIRALYILGGAVIGYARRHVAIVASESDLGTADPPREDESGTVTIPPQHPVADMTVVIETDEQIRGRLRWTLTTPHTWMPPSAPLVCDIGDDPQHFARQLVDGVGAREGRAGLGAYLLGVGHTIAEQVPTGFWPVLEFVANHARNEGRPPSIFILSEDPYVPWELATVEPRLDPHAPPFLGAQACVGRWVLGNRRPKLPPPAEVSVNSIAVVSGEYTLPGWSRLVEAEAEATALQDLYGAAPVAATAEEVLECLDGQPPAELLHFAMHGIYDPNSTLNGLVLADGQTIDPLQVRGHALTSTPFVFLNACQVGSSQRILGDYAGLAEAFLFSGAAGVLAPLWSIKDTTAREIALRFYEQSFAGMPPADILRRERSAGGGSSITSATSLAYLFYGHPSLRLHRPTGGADA